MLPWASLPHLEATIDMGGFGTSNKVNPIAQESQGVSLPLHRHPGWELGKTGSCPARGFATTKYHTYSIFAWQRTEKKEM